MSDNENQNEDLKAFEASLGSLRPCADGLDRRWRFLLAQEATFNHSLGDCPDFRVGENGTVPFAPSVCSRCGSTISSGRRDNHRWAWPTAFSAVSAIAAALFVMLLVRSGAQTAMPANEPRLAMPSASVSRDQTDAASWSVPGYGLSRRSVSGSDDASYLDLRDQVLRYGVDSWSLPASAVAAVKIADPPRSYREQLDRLLKQESFRGS
jgi:hypothetical protein